MTAPTVIRTAAAITLTIATVCQFLQRTDPTFPLLYFTVDSAALMAVVLSASLARPTSANLDVVRGAATVGVVLSAVIYATVIAPHTATGTWFAPWDDAFVRTATVLMHGVGPFLVVADFLTHGYPAAQTRRTLIFWCTWPLTYITVIALLATIGIGHVPYTFLSPANGGGIIVVSGAVLALTGISALLSYALLRAHRAVFRATVGS